MAEGRGTYTTNASSDDSTAQDAPSEPGKIIPLAGCITGDAREVNRRLKQARYPSRITQFLRQLEEMTFSQAGMHRKWGHTNPGSWCWFELAQWASDLAMPKSTLLHLRKRLIDDRVVWFEPHPDTAGVGRIGWNLNFSEWKPLQPGYPTWGGARAGAGKKKSTVEAQPTIDNLNNTIDNLKTGTSAGISSCQQPLSSYQSTYAENAFKLSKDDSSEAGADAARDSGPNNSYENKENPANAGRRFTPFTSVVSAQAQASHDTPSEQASDRATQRADTQTPPSSAAPPRKRAAKPAMPARELSPKDQYRVDLLAAIKAANDGCVTGEHGMEWKAAGMLYDWPGGPAAITAVVECFTITRRLPKYDTKELHVMDLVAGAKHFAAYLRSGRDAYRKGIERARAAANGEFEAGNRASGPPARSDRDRPPEVSLDRMPTF